MVAGEDRPARRSGTCSTPSTHGRKTSAAAGPSTRLEHPVEPHRHRADAATPGPRPGVVRADGPATMAHACAGPRPCDHRPRAGPARSRAVPARRRRRRRPARPRLHRHAAVAARLGRAPRRRRAHRAPAAPARARHPLAGAEPHPLAGLVRRGRARAARPRAPPGTASSSAGCRWAGRCPAARRRSTPTSSPGSCWSTRPSLAEDRRLAAAARCCATWSPRSRPSAATSASRAVTELAYDRTPLHAACVVDAAAGHGQRADLPHVTAPLLRAAQPARTTSSPPASTAAVLAGVSLTDVEDVVAATDSSTWPPSTTTPRVVFERSLGVRPARHGRGAARERRASRHRRRRPPARRRRPLRRHRRPLPRRRAGPAPGGRRPARGRRRRRHRAGAGDRPRRRAERGLDAPDDRRRRRARAAARRPSRPTSAATAPAGRHAAGDARPPGTTAAPTRPRRAGPRRYEQAAREELAAARGAPGPRRAREARVAAEVDRAVDGPPSASCRPSRRRCPAPPTCPRAWRGRAVLLGPVALVLFALLWRTAPPWLVGACVTAVVAGFVLPGLAAAPHPTIARTAATVPSSDA